MNCPGFAPLEPRLPQGEGEHAGMLWEAGGWWLNESLGDAMGTASLNILCCTNSATKSHLHGAVLVSVGLEDIPVCPTGAGLMFITADCIRQRFLTESFGAELRDCCPLLRSSSGETYHCHELHPAFLLTPAGIRDSVWSWKHVPKCLRKTLSDSPTDSTQQLQSKQCLEDGSMAPGLQLGCTGRSSRLQQLHWPGFQGSTTTPCPWLSLEYKSKDI